MEEKQLLLHNLHLEEKRSESLPLQSNVFSTDSPLTSIKMTFTRCSDEFLGNQTQSNVDFTSRCIPRSPQAGSKLF